MYNKRVATTLEALGIQPSILFFTFMYSLFPRKGLRPKLLKITTSMYFRHTENSIYVYTFVQINALGLEDPVQLKLA